MSDKPDGRDAQHNCSVIGSFPATHSAALISRVGVWIVFGLLGLICVYIAIAMPVWDDEGYFLYGARGFITGHPVPLIYGTVAAYLINVPAAYASGVLRVSLLMCGAVDYVIMALICVVLVSQVVSHLHDLWAPMQRWAMVTLLLPLLLVCPVHGLFRNDIGEREFILLVGIIPYLVLAMGRIAGASVPAWLTVLVGAFASPGLLQKPFFLLIWLGIVACVARERGWRSVLVPENSVLLSLVVLYVFLYPVEFTGLASTAASYRCHMGPPLVVAACCTPPIVFGASLWLLDLRGYLMPCYRAGLWALAASTLLAAAQGNALEYHFIPCYAISAITAVAAIGRTPVPVTLAPQHIELPIALIVVGELVVLYFEMCPCLAPVMVPPGWFQPRGWTDIPVASLALWVAVDMSERQPSNAQAWSRHAGVLVALLPLLATGLWFLRDIWFRSNMHLEKLLMAGALSVLLSTAVRARGWVSSRYVQATVAAWLGLMGLVCLNTAIYCRSLVGRPSTPTSGTVEMVAKQYARNGGAFVFSTNPDPPFPGICDDKVDLGPVFSILYYLPSFYLSQEGHNDVTQYHRPSQMSSLERSVYDGIIEDLQRRWPDLLVFGGPSCKVGFKDQSFSFLAYFMQDPRFRAIWRHYRRVADPSWAAQAAYCGLRFYVRDPVRGVNKTYAGPQESTRPKSGRLTHLASLSNASKHLGAKVYE